MSRELMLEAGRLLVRAVELAGVATVDEEMEKDLEKKLKKLGQALELRREDKEREEEHERNKQAEELEDLESALLGEAIMAISHMARLANKSCLTTDVMEAKLEELETLKTALGLLDFAKESLCCGGRENGPG